MTADDRITFPPVIIYTGKALSAEEEEKLRSYSSSIIVKGARSPERLLDEVTLFLHSVEADLPVERQKQLVEVRSRESIFEGRTVLIVEDDVRNVFALSSLLEPRGLKTVIARNGREALEILSRSDAVDLVLMDVMMPEMNGIEATKEIRKQRRYKTLPIIALTAKAMADDRQECLDAGASDYLSKPIDVDMLLSLLRVWMPR
jgi:CheY-like chemotaxis protein